MKLNININGVLYKNIIMQGFSNKYYKVFYKVIDFALFYSFRSLNLLPKLAKLILKDYLIELLKFDDEYYRALALWKIAGRVLSTDEVKEYLTYYIALLKSERENHRLWMWKLVPIFIKISDKKEIMNNLNYFLELLKSEDEDIRIEALLNEEDIKQYSKYLLELLQSKEKSIRVRAWRLVIKLLTDFDKGINS